MVLHGGFPPDPRVAREIRAAIDDGYEVDLVCLRRADITESATENVFGARVIRLPIVHKYGVSFSALVWEYTRFTTLATARVAQLGFRRRYSVIHVHNPPDFLVVTAIIPKLLVGSRLLFDVHDLAPDMFAMRFGNRRGSRFADRLLRLLERSAVGFADAVITVHEPYRNELQARGIEASKITVVMNSVDEKTLPPLRRASRQRGFRIVYHGTLAPHYGVELLVDAVARVSSQIDDLHVDIYGIGDSLPRARVRADRLRIGDRVNFAGGLPQADVLAAIQGASVGVIPNLPTRLNRYALSSKLFEYVVLGIPTVAADLPTLRAHFSGDEVLFFRAGDASALGDALLSVAEDPVAARARAAAALRRYENYRWPLYRARYLSLLRALAAEPEPPDD